MFPLSFVPSKPAVLTGLFLSVLLVFASSAEANASSPAADWGVHSVAVPSRFSSEDNNSCESGFEVEGAACDQYQATFTNVGSIPTGTDAEVAISDTVPSGLTVKRVELYWPGLAKMLGIDPRTDAFPVAQGAGLCSAVPVRCAVSFKKLEEDGRCVAVECSVAPDESIQVVIYVTVNLPGATGELTNSAVVTGGGIAKATAQSENQLGGELPSFGASVSALISEPNGRLDSRAGSHPYEFTTRIDFNSEMRVGPRGDFAPTSVEDPRDIVVDLPLGLLGSTLATKTCTFAELSSKIQDGVGGCPTDTIIGHIVSEPASSDSIAGPIYNLQPEHGAAAEFGYIDLLAGAHVLYGSVVPTPAGYVLQTAATEIPQVPLTNVVATFYGDPAAKDGASGPQTGFFTTPSQCSGVPLPMLVHMDSWQHPGNYEPDGSPELSDPAWVTTQSEVFPEGVSGCELLQFAPELSAQPFSGTQSAPAPAGADSPAGLNFSLKLAQPEEFGTLATPPLRKAVVSLPVGMTVDPSSANGLGACSETQVGYEGFNNSSEAYEFTAAKPVCPEASKIGTVSLRTPLIPGTLEGDVYLATQDANPFNSLLAAYIVVDDSTTGTIVKIPGEVKANPGNGQLTGVFDSSPQFPFDEFQLHFKGTASGVLATPEKCGSYTTTSELTPWSAPASGPAATPEDDFQITSGCVSGFSPSFSAGSTSTQAGGYAPFHMTFARTDTDEEISGLTVTLPPGLLAKVASVSLCTDAEVAAAASNPSGVAETANPSCPESSKVGTVLAGAGPGPSPFFAPGSVYLTGPYRGAPYGLAVVVPAVAGPFDLGNVVVRVALHIDPSDGHVTAISDPFPTMLNNTGIAIRLRRVDLNISRSDFTLNPTSCDPMTINGTLKSTGGVTAAVSSPFQVGNCQGLAFKPVFSAATVGKASKANGASLDVKVAYPNAPFNGYANIKSVKVSLPKQLPSRLTTLQKACLAATFEANPASCPSASDVGTATASTPLLSSPLVGPAYIVSHGNEAFPDLEVVLQGNNITLVLDGNTLIKNGITSSTFKSVPDAPVSSFDLKLPTGKFSILGANVPAGAKYSLCGQNLTMPTEITAQNGALLNQTTKIAISGCAKIKTLTRAEKLKKALKACHQDKKRAKRAKCEKQAHKRYGPVKSKKKAEKK